MTKKTDQTFAVIGAAAERVKETLRAFNEALGAAAALNINVTVVKEPEKYESLLDDTYRVRSVVPRAKRTQFRLSRLDFELK